MENNRGKILYLECYSGISGDMTVGALLDLGADRARLERALESMGVGGYHLHFGRKLKCGIDAYDFDVHLEEDGYEHGHGDGHGHGHSHGNHGHSHSHEAAENHGHEHSHELTEGHGHEPHEHSHNHNHEPAEGHGHEHHEHSHSHSHELAEEYGHEHHEHSHSHSHELAEEHGHEHHEHSHNHSHEPAEGHSHPHPHIHRNLYDIYALIDRLQEKEAVKAMARRIFEIVAEAESKAHGLPVEQVHFHEVGAVDSIVDIVSTAVLLDDLGVEKVIVSPLAEGHGYVRCQHGVMPVPVPATANIAAAYGLNLRLTDNDGEMVTPTGAAIAAALSCGEDLPERYIIEKIGVGAGNKDFKNANILRAMILRPQEEKRDVLWKLETNIDDCTGEALGYTLEKLMKAGALDAYCTPIQMKKNRPAYELSVMCRETDREMLEEIIFCHTTTIGIRRYPVERTVLERRELTVETAWGQVKAKLCGRGDRWFCYPEYESVRAICENSGLSFQEAYDGIKRAAERSREENR